MLFIDVMSQLGIATILFAAINAAVDIAIQSSLANFADGVLIMIFKLNKLIIL